MKQVTVSITFNVLDSELLRVQAETGAYECWLQDLDTIIDVDDLGAVIVEALLSSNPEVQSYDSYGLELVDSQTINVKEN